jgi:hypothetical protein
MAFLTEHPVLQNLIDVKGKRCGNNFGIAFCMPESTNFKSFDFEALSIIT